MLATSSSMASLGLRTPVNPAPVYGQGAAAESPGAGGSGDVPPGLERRGSLPNRLAPVFAGPSAGAKSAWQRAQSKIVADLKHGKTMFDDGRFLRSVIAEAKSSGREPPPKLLARRSSSIAKDPTTSQLEDGPDGGGGVRLFPPHLDDVLNE